MSRAAPVTTAALDFNSTKDSCDFRLPERAQDLRIPAGAPAPKRKLDQRCSSQRALSAGCKNRRVRYPGILLIVCALIATWHLFSGRAVSHARGVLVDADPEQVALDSAPPLPFDGVQLIPHATFKAKARVLGRERYHLGKLADIAPLDIAVGWGPMSDSALLESVKISQSNRFYYWHYDEEPEIGRRAIETHSANWHLIPATKAAWHTLSQLRVGDVVTLDGELVDIESADFGTIRTSLSRDDTGGGACEIVFVQSARIDPR